MPNWKFAYSELVVRKREMWLLVILLISPCWVDVHRQGLMEVRLSKHGLFFLELDSRLLIQRWFFPMAIKNLSRGRSTSWNIKAWSDLIARVISFNFLVTFLTELRIGVVGLVQEIFHVFRCICVTRWWLLHQLSLTVHGSNHIVRRSLLPRLFERIETLTWYIPTKWCFSFLGGFLASIHLFPLYTFSKFGNLLLF